MKGLFYGGKPSSNLPFLWKLKDEVETAVTNILQQEENHLLNSAFSNRDNPRYSKLSYFLADLETQLLHSILEDIEASTGLKPLCLIYDGAIIEADNSAKREALSKSLKECESKFNVKLKICDY